jgi:imidazolonepropionase-like amidohydrolase
MRTTMKNFKQIIFILFAITLFISNNVSAQNPAPAPPEKDAILIMNGTAHIGNGTVIENSAIGIKDGKIVLVGDATKIKLDKSAYPIVIDASGKQIYPGFIECNSTIGITEIDLVRSTRDFGEVGDINPNVRSIIAYNTDSKISATVRSNGVLMAQVVPDGNFITGQSSVVELDAWNWEDALYKADDGIHINWPRMFIIYNHPTKTEEQQKQDIDAAMNAIEGLFNDAKAYSLNSKPQEKNVKLEAMRGLFDRTKKLYVHCDYVKAIVSAVSFAKKYGIKMVLVGGNDCHMVTDLLKANDVPVILGRTHSLPPREDDDVYIQYKLPSILQNAGITFAISVEGSWQARNVMFNAGNAAAFGLTHEQALASVTSSPAKILGIGDRAGTLEEGKDATLFISDGDALDMRTNNVVRAFMRGRDINLDNIQKQLYLKYKEKYAIQK